MLLIGGGVANFTNVATTFRGIIHAIRDFHEALRAHAVKIYVRRGGPNHQEGLRAMREVGESLRLPIFVFGPETHMTAIVGMALGVAETPANPAAAAVLTPSLYELQPPVDGPKASSVSHQVVGAPPPNNFNLFNIFL